MPLETKKERSQSGNLEESFEALFLSQGIWRSDSFKAGSPWAENSKAFSQGSWTGSSANSTEDSQEEHQDDLSDEEASQCIDFLLRDDNFGQRRPTFSQLKALEGL